MFGMPKKDKEIKIVSPCLGKEEERAVLNVLRSGNIAQGAKVKFFEEEFSKYIGVKHSVAVSSGTAALYLVLLALGIGPGDEVITTPFTFIASANAILYTGAKPVFVDVDEKTFNINSKLIKEKINSRTKAIMPVHLYGLSSEMEEIMAIARQKGIFVIEDACQAHGAEIKDKKVGSIGTAGCFSFYPTKNMITGEGGMITTNNEKLADKARLLREHGTKVRYHHDSLGFNFRMTDLEASIGIEQLKKLPEFNKERINSALFLNKFLSKIEGIIIPFVPVGYKHVFHQYTIRITDKYKITREELIKHLNNKGIGTAIYYPVPIHKQKVYVDLGYKDEFPVTEKLSKEVLSLPIHPGLNELDLRRIVKNC